MTKHPKGIIAYLYRKIVVPRSLHPVTPSEDFASCDIGDVIEIEDKSFCLVGRDPWTAYLVRYYWIDDWIGKLWRWRYGEN